MAIAISTIKKILLFGTGSTLFALVLTGLTVKQISDRSINAITSLLQPQPTELEVADSTILLEKIQNLQELTTTIYQTETVIPTSADRTFGKNWTVATTKMLYLARGEVKAGINLNQLTKDDIEITSDKIAIAIPSAEILDSKIDVNHSQVYHYDRGFFNLGPDVAPQLQTLAQQKTLTRIVANACNEGILNQANQQAKKAIASLITATNDREVKITINPKPSSSCK